MLASFRRCSGKGPNLSTNEASEPPGTYSRRMARQPRVRARFTVRARVIFRVKTSGAPCECSVLNDLSHPR